MCIIIYKPANAALDPSLLRNAYKRNRDGWGLAAITRDGVKIERGFGPFEAEALVNAAERYYECDLVIHCRIGTSGERSLKNTHPFEVRQGLYMFHNGILNVDRSSDLSQCDSFHAAKMLGECFSDISMPELFADDTYLEKLDDWAGNSRLVFVDASGVYFVNKELGDWKDGVWFSNTSAHSSRSYGIFGASHDDEEDSLYQDGFSERTDAFENGDTLETFDFEEVIDLADDLDLMDYDDIRDLCITQPDLVAEAIYHRRFTRDSDKL